MFIIYYDICAIIILGILFAALLMLKSAKGRTYRLMVWVFVIMLVSSLTDMLSCYGASYFTANSVHKFLMYLFNYIYFFSHCTILPAMILYICSSIGIWHILTNDKILRYVGITAYVLNMLLILSNLFTNQVFYIDDNMQYVRGNQISFIYILFLIFAVLSLIILYRHRCLVPKQKLIVFLSMYPSALIAIIIQAINPHLPVEMFFYSIFAILFLVVVQTKEENINPIFGTKKYTEGLVRMRNVFAANTPAVLIFFKINNWKSIQLQLGREKYNNFLFLQSQYLNGAIKLNKLECELYYMEKGLYCILIDDQTKESYNKLAKDILNHYEEALMYKAIAVNVDAFVCITRCPQDIQDYSTLFNVATTFHKTMPYSGDVLRFSDFVNNKDFMLGIELDRIIDNAIANNDFEIYYQPIYSVENKRFTSAEALVRLNNEKYGMISPLLFIPAAEKSGAIHKIGDFVLEDVCRFIKKGQLNQYGIDSVEINLSISQCIEENLVDKVDTLVKKYDISYKQLIFEMTESDDELDPGVGDRNIEELHRKGVRFALDGYGMGYSNIQHILKLPIDLVKLDKSFVDEMDNEDMWTVICETIRTLKEMNKKVIAEGVEREDAASKISSLDIDYVQGCEFMQGFFFCKPLPETEFIEFLQSIQPNL